MPIKSFLRDAVLKKRKMIPAALRRRKSRLIFKKLLREPSFRKAKCVALYYGVPGEVETRPFLKKILKSKKVYLPRVQLQRKDLVFRRFCALSDLEKNAYAIMEPKVQCLKRSAFKMDLIVVPGVAFDKKGGRLGRGAGYYDRLLRKAPKVPKFGLCFREQIVKKVPMRSHDIRMDKVITD